MAFNWRKPFTRSEDGTSPIQSSENDANGRSKEASLSTGVADGDLKYTLEQGGNDSPPSYQEVSGAPVERHSPLGYTVGPITILALNISKMIGTGVYSTRECRAFPTKPLTLLRVADDCRF